MLTAKEADALERKKSRAGLHWRNRRNRIVTKLLADDPKLPRIEALRRANKMMKQTGAKA